MYSGRTVQQKCNACRVTDSPCDFMRHKCGRCAAASIACVRGEPPVEFAFVDQNEVAATASRRAARRRSRKNSRWTNIPLDVALLDHSVQSQTRHDPLLPLGPPILQSLEDRVIQRFVSRWAARQTSLGCLDSMPELLEASGEDSAMQKAILATAYADLAVYERHGAQRAECYRAYSASLRRIRDDLSNPNFVASDGMLGAIFAIDAFELLYMGRTDPLGFHTQAIIRFLELRKNADIDHKQSFALWRSAHQRIYVRQLFYQIPSFASVSVIDTAFEDDDQPEVQTIKFVANACDTMSKLEKERSKPAEHMNQDEILRLCNVLRTLMQETHERSAQSMRVPQPRWIPLNMQTNPELRHIFPQTPVVVFDDFWMARDRVLASVCNIKILDLLIDVRTQVFSSDPTRTVDVEVTRDYLLESQPDLTSLQSNCRFVLDVTPFLIGLVDPNGYAKLDPWTLNDTGVLSAKSPLHAIGRLKYAQSSVKQEANAIVAFLNENRHVLSQS